MLDRIHLKIGAGPGEDPISFAPGTITLLVGPSNSGKSLLLQEIGARLTGPGMDPRPLILDAFTYSHMSLDEINGFLTTAWVEHVDPADPPTRRRFSRSNATSSQSIQLNESELAPGADYAALIPRLLVTHVLKLDGERRLNLLSPAETQPLRNQPSSFLMALLRDDEGRRQLRDISQKAFGLYFTVDVTELKKVRARLSRRAPNSVAEERGIEEEAISFHEAAEPLDSFSDGYRAYLGILAAAVSSEYRVILVDEPEAFLHPPLQRSLGSELVRLLQARKGSLFAATHSADFLMGCIQSGASINVVRMTYVEAVATAHLLPSDDLVPLIRDPIIRSSRFLTALFHRRAVQSEGDTDRVLYEEIAHRLEKASSTQSDVLFLNGNGKQTVHRLIGALRRLGLPAAAVVDLDIIKEKDLGALLRAARAPDDLVDTLNGLKRTTRKAFETLNRDPKDAGIAALPAGKARSARHLLSLAAEYGVFIVEVGDAEHWLQSLGVHRKGKADHLREVLEKLGSDSTAEGYVHPSEEDVWAFVTKILAWIANPRRDGM